MTQLWDPLRLSLLVSTSATLLLALIGVPLAWVLARRSFPGKTALDILISIPLVLPPTVLGYYLVVVLGRNGILGRWIQAATGWSPLFTWQGAALAAFVVALPLTVRVSRTALEGVDGELLDACATLGKSEWTQTWRVLLPLARPGIQAGLLLGYARALGEFGATLMVAGNIPGRTSTLPLSIYTAFEQGNDLLAQEMALLLTLTSAGVIYLSQRWASSTTR